MAPMFSTRAWTPATDSSTSRMSWAMVGEPPAARTILAQSFTVTKFVMHCTRGTLSPTAARAAAKSRRSMVSHRLS